MGIPGLRKFLNENEIIQYKSKFPDDINVIAIDAMFIIHKYLHSNNEEVLFSVLNQILKFLTSGITPIYILDGKSSIHKKAILTKRKNKRKKYLKKLNELKLLLMQDPENKDLIIKIKQIKKLCKKLSNKLIENFKNLLDILNIKYIIAKGEADFTCCKLCEMNMVDACLSEDMDFLTLGCKNLFYFRKSQTKNNICQIEISHLLDKINLTKKQFQLFCIILGNDFNIKKIRLCPNEVYDNIIKYENIENWYNNEMNIEVKTYLKDVIKNIYLISNIYKNVKVNYINLKLNKNKSIDIKELQRFFDSIVKPSSYKYHYTNKLKKLINLINYENLLYSDIY